MKLNEVFVNEIEERIRKIENTYSVSVLFWNIRGSGDIGIYRKNSDIDIIFVYKSDNKKNRAIHDIIGHGYDLWGWIIDDVFKTIINSFGKNDVNFHYLTKEHARASLNNYFGFFVAIGNKLLCDRSGFINDNFSDLINIMDRKSIIFEFQNEIIKYVKRIENENKLSGNEMLYAFWYCEMSEKIISGGLPGENKLSDMIKNINDILLKSEIEDIKKLYNKSVTKHGQKFYSEKIFGYIIKQYKENIEFLASNTLCFNELDMTIEKIKNKNKLYI